MPFDMQPTTDMTARRQQNILPPPHMQWRQMHELEETPVPCRAHLNKKEKDN